MEEEFHFYMDILQDEISEEGISSSAENPRIITSGELGSHSSGTIENSLTPEKNSKLGRWTD